MSSALTGATETLDEELAREASPRAGAAAERLVGEAAELLRSVVAVWRLIDGPPRDPSRRVAEGLAARLRSHEADVLAGELTYALDAVDAEAPIARARQTLGGLRDSGQPTFGAVLSLQTAAVEIAAMLVRAAANADVAGTAQSAAADIGESLEGELRGIVGEIEEHAAAAQRGRATGGDLVGHHLAGAIRTEVPAAALSTLERPAGGVGTLDAMGTARVAWLQLASREHVVTTALDTELGEPSYAARFGTLDNAIVQGSANVLSGGRLLGRPEQFRHHKAWSNQGIVLSHAVEVYIAALRGQRAGFGQAQLIVLTRLLRATVAIGVLDLRHAKAR